MSRRGGWNEAASCIILKTNIWYYMYLINTRNTERIKPVRVSDPVQSFKTHLPSLKTVRYSRWQRPIKPHYFHLTVIFKVSHYSSDHIKDSKMGWSDVWGREGIWLVNLRERDNSEDLDADAKIILKYISKKWDGVYRLYWSDSGYRQGAIL